MNINRDGFALDVIPLVCQNGLYNNKIDNLHHLLLAVSMIPTIENVNPLTPQLDG
jgi:hypothetical protein